MLLPPVSEFIAGALRRGRKSKQGVPKSSCNDKYVYDSSNSEELTLSPTSVANSTVEMPKELKVILEQMSQPYQAPVVYISQRNVLPEYQYQHVPVQPQFQNQYPMYPVSAQSSPNLMQNQQPLYFNSYQNGIRPVFNPQISVEGLYYQHCGFRQNTLQVEAVPFMPTQNNQPRFGMFENHGPQFLPVNMWNTSSVDLIPLPQSDRGPDLQVKDKRIRRKHIFYTRTRTGCLTCKKRKVKCDEGKPGCKNCRKSHRKCEGYGEKVSEETKKSIPQTNNIEHKEQEEAGQRSEHYQGP